MAFEGGMALAARPQQLKLEVIPITAAALSKVDARPRKPTSKTKGRLTAIRLKQ